MTEVNSAPVLDAVGPKVPEKGQVGMGKVTVAPPAQPTKPPAQPSLAARANAALGATAQRPAGIKLFNTNELRKQTFLHCVLYSETSARKTTLAAEFAGSQFTRIILTRNKEQLKPLEDDGYQVAWIEDAPSLLYALRYPEQLWPDWAAMADPEGKKTIVVDDVTQAVSTLVSSNAGSKDRRQSYTGAMDDLDSVIPALQRKPYNLILIALAKVKENSLTNVDQIKPDIPPSISNYILSGFEGVFFVRVPSGAGGQWKLLTDRDTFAVEEVDPNTGKVRTYTREIFAKVKLSAALARQKPPVVPREVPADLRQLWDMIQRAKKQPST